MKLGTNFFRSQTPSHMTVRQLVMVAIVVATSAALLVVDNNANSNGDSNGNIDNAMNFVEVSGLSAMPFISANDSMTTNWFCPGVPRQRRNHLEQFGDLERFGSRYFGNGDIAEL